MAASRPIVIAGAGIGGLTAALALAAKGFRIVLLEKAERLQEAGAGLQLSPNASRVLIDLGLLPRLAPHLVMPGAVSIMSVRSGGEVARLPLGAADAEAPYWLIHRADLQAALLAEVAATPGIDLRLGSPLRDFEVDSAGVAVGSGDGGEAIRAAALIGADGVWSAVRQRLFPAIRADFSGLIAWRGTVDIRQLPDGLAQGHVQLWMGPKAHLVAYPMSSGTRVNVVAILPGDWHQPGWSAPGDAGEIRDHFAASRWPGNARQMIGAIEDWRRWALFTLPDGSAWQQGPVALLGDAAHAMLPFAAQGAGMAIEDAAVLAGCCGDVIDDPAQMAAGLARYAALRHARVARVQRTARQSGKIYHLQGPMALARDLAMKALGASLLQKRQAWIYDWRP